MFSIYCLFSHQLCIIKDCITTNNAASCWQFDARFDDLRSVSVDVYMVIVEREKKKGINTAA